MMIAPFPKVVNQGLLRFGHNSERLAERADLGPKMAHFERKSYVFGLLQGLKSLPSRVETIYDRISEYTEIRS